MAVPPILRLLTTDWVRGRNLHQKLSRDGCRISKPSFYWIMFGLVNKEACLHQQTNGDIHGIEATIDWFRLPLTAAEKDAEDRDLSRSYIEEAHTWNQM